MLKPQRLQYAIGAAFAIWLGGFAANLWLTQPWRSEADLRQAVLSSKEYQTVRLELQGGITEPVRKKVRMVGAGNLKPTPLLSVEFFVEASANEGQKLDMRLLGLRRSIDSDLLWIFFSVIAASGLGAFAVLALPAFYQSRGDTSIDAANQTTLVEKLLASEIQRFTALSEAFRRRASLLLACGLLSSAIAAGALFLLFPSQILEPLSFPKRASGVEVIDGGSSAPKAPAEQKSQIASHFATFGKPLVGIAFFQGLAMALLRQYRGAVADASRYDSWRLKLVCLVGASNASKEHEDASRLQARLIEALIAARAEAESGEVKSDPGRRDKAQGT